MSDLTREVADLLHAAELIEQRAEKATKRLCPRWTYHAVRHVARNCDIECSEHDWDNPEFTDDDCPTFDRYEDAPWISLMSAHVAAPLVAWLRDEAEELVEGPSGYAVAFARAVLSHPGTTS